MKREFYFQDDRSNKFWIVEVDGGRLLTTHGRIGSKGRETSKTFATEEAALREAEKQIAGKLKKGYVEGAVANAPAYKKRDWAAMDMSEDVFWQIIALFNWKKTGNDDAVIEPAVAALAQMEPTAIAKFQDILSEKLYALDTEAHAREIGEYAYDGEYLSVDFFLYARCVVVANGRDFFESVRANPAEMPKDLEFESLLYVAPNAYERKTGQELDHVSPLSVETYSNESGWRNAASRES